MGGAPGAGENTLRRLALFVYLDHPTKNDVTSGERENQTSIWHNRSVSK